MTDEPVAVCPTCGGAGRRLFFPAGIVFKGSGFYKTDSRKASTGSSDTGPAKGGASKAGSDGAKPAKESTSTPAAGSTESSG